ncbi:hypothetical protein BB561_001463 [Smittium simulii]|uniref:Uncharacterized protein n=1 Tax=Smittium simulii TaxID=133385 RepID=A0A2T9YUK9_9FUNG|nr:hypothetical protein BB561_001463 [Smittium simulii]
MSNVPGVIPSAAARVPLIPTKRTRLEYSTVAKTGYIDPATKNDYKQPTVVTVQETLLNKKSYRYRLPGYTVIESKSDHNLGGNGLLIALKNNSGLQIFELKQHPH